VTTVYWIGGFVKKMLRVAVLGAGNGAHAIAGDLALRGFPVRLYNKFEHEIAALRQAGGVHIVGTIEGFGAIEMATTDPALVVPWADVLMVVVPAFAHAAMAEACAPYLRDGQVIVLNPGRTGGALEFRSVLRRLGVQAQVKVAETQSLVFACRISGPARVHVGGVKASVLLAALPATDTPAVLKAVGSLYPQFQPASNVLETGLDNVGAVFHPTTTLLNAGRIDAGEKFEFYAQGITPAIAGVLERIDAERVAVSQAFGVPTMTADEWLSRAYPDVHPYVRGTTFHERITTNPSYQGIKAPIRLDVRYLTEDVPTGLVPLASLGELAGVATPLIRSMVHVANALLKQDFWKTGRNAANLGLAGMSVQEVRAWL
jgi:opine dehydrogenase